MVVGMILSGGIGNRFGSDIPKQYCELSGKPVIAYSIEAMNQSKKIDHILVVCNGLYQKQLSTAYQVDCVEGGNTRNESLRKGLVYISCNFPKCEKVLIHEAARPFILPEIIDIYIEKLNEYDAVITAQRITDSLGSINEWVINREDYYLIQTPEAFRFPILFEHFDSTSMVTATSQQLPPDSKIYRNFSFVNNLKITYKQDLELANFMMRGI